MNQRETAKLLGLKPQYLNAVVNGHRRPSPELAERLEMATGVSRTVWIWGKTVEKKAAFKKEKSEGKP